MKQYRTSEVAAMMGIHPNTVRFYEEWGLITKPVREKNGYRVFSDLHLYQIQVARLGFEIEILQNGLRKKIVEVIKTCAKCDFDGAIRQTEDFCLGRAGFEAPVGWIEGELTRKRQFKIQNGIMEYAIESSTNVQDEVLQKELAHTSDEKMKSIISTIQREQNVIIRNEKANTLMIQGVAGSGKTSIALHRIAFLLYRFKNQITAEDVAILSPNKVFADYISGVIPELGEEPICELSLQDIAGNALKEMIAFEPEKNPLENEDEAWAKRAKFKSNLAFVGVLDQYIDNMSERVFSAKDYTCQGHVVPAAWLNDRFNAYKTIPVKNVWLLWQEMSGRFYAL